MKWATSISEAGNTAAAIADVRHAVEQALGEVPDLLIVFASPHHNAEIGAAIAGWRGTDLAREMRVIGCSALGVIGEGHEVEQRRCLAVAAATLPGVAIEVTAIDAEPAAMTDWLDAQNARPGDATFFLLTDPATFDLQPFVDRLDGRTAGTHVFGGIASGAAGDGSTLLLANDEALRSGAVCARLTGAINVHTVVAQGCRPIGEPMLITKCRDNAILELGELPPVTVLQTLYKSLQPRDQALFMSSLFVGIEMEDRVEYAHGDFLIRHILGMDPDTGAIAVNTDLRQWQVLQFHLRDARTSKSDLEAVLSRFKSENPTVQPAAALLFSCLGRGVHLYQRPDHDTDLFREALGDVPLAGFFCNGEIGPVGGRTFLHGYTSVFALFSRPNQTATRASTETTS